MFTNGKERRQSYGIEPRTSTLQVCSFISWYQASEIKTPTYTLTVPKGKSLKPGLWKLWPTGQKCKIYVSLFSIYFPLTPFSVKSWSTSDDLIPFSLKYAIKSNDPPLSLSRARARTHTPLLSVMDIIKTGKKGRYFNTLEKYRIYKISKNKLHTNDTYIDIR
jgi:hypothetical protein